jgi:nucleotidyltransferase substrate binding protein (TIGR01987 family)
MRLPKIMATPPAKDSGSRWRQRLQSFRKASADLTSAADLAAQRTLSYLETLGLIHVFEFTHELAWKTLKDFLESRGTTELFGSRDATREAFAGGLIDDGEAWMEMIKSRNRTSHTYDEETVKEIAQAIVSSYASEFEKFLARFTELARAEP